jgi:carboxymethylenebutenolidase
MLEFQVDDDTVSAYLAVPKSGQGIGIVVLHAWWGLTQRISKLVKAELLYY